MFNCPACRKEYMKTLCGDDKDEALKLLNEMHPGDQAKVISILCARAIEEGYTEEILDHPEYGYLCEVALDNIREITKKD